MLFNFLAKYTYTNGDCLEYGGPLQDSKDFDTLAFTATQCLLDPKCRAFKYIFGEGLLSGFEVLNRSLATRGLRASRSKTFIAKL